VKVEFLDKQSGKVWGTNMDKQDREDIHLGEETKGNFSIKCPFTSAINL
jgi:hypothetical protein